MMIKRPQSAKALTHATLHNIRNTQCLGVVLAGGLSSRMGVEKSGLIRNEVNMLNYSKQLLTDSGIQSIVISGQPSCASKQDILIKDIHNNAGPVGGIASVVQSLKPTSILLLPVDLPLMTFSALQKLKHIGEISQQACFYENNFLPLYLPVNAFVESFLATTFQHLNNSNNTVGNSLSNTVDNTPHKNGPSIRSLLNQIPHKALKIEEPSTLFNTNTPDEWKTAQSTFSSKHTENVKQSITTPSSYKLT